MTKEQIQRYTLRITQANRSQIIVILYDMILDDVTEASECYDDYDSFKTACNKIT